MLVQLPLLVAHLAVTGGLLGRLGVHGPIRWWGAAGTTVMAPVLTYAGMLHFALASSAATVAAVWAYVASDRLSKRAPAVALGMCLGVLSLSRVVSLVYAAAVLLPCAFHAVYARHDIRRRLVNAALAGAAGAAVAAPWWLVNGRASLTYLLGAGYDEDSGFAPRTGLASRVVDRLTHTADESGWILAAILLIGAVVSLRRPGSVRLVGSSGFLGILLLGSSSNAGTAFGLPPVVLLAVAALTVPRLRVVIAADDSERSRSARPAWARCPRAAPSRSRLKPRQRWGAHASAGCLPTCTPRSCRRRDRGACW